MGILRGVAPGERYATVPYVRPGGESLLRISGWPKVEKVLQAIDAIEALGIDPADAAPDHWQHIHNRLSVGEQPRPYTHTRHQAWLHRRRRTPCQTVPQRSSHWRRPSPAWRPRRARKQRRVSLWTSPRA